MISVPHLSPREYLDSRGGGRKTKRKGGGHDAGGGGPDRRRLPTTTPCTWRPAPVSTDIPTRCQPWREGERGGEGDVSCVKPATIPFADDDKDDASLRTCTCGEDEMACVQTCAWENSACSSTYILVVVVVV
ncbi:hypothetical protein BHE74_00005206 [Ensete ventricosum]|nr:hypothetical protein BHE74_00005206 [Ensete ventricosum]